MSDPAKLTWGLWVVTETSYKAHGFMVEKTFRDIMRGLLGMNMDFDRALDKAKDILIAEMGRVAAARKPEDVGSQ